MIVGYLVLGLFCGLCAAGIVFVLSASLLHVIGVFISVSVFCTLLATVLLGPQVATKDFDEW